MLGWTSEHRISWHFIAPGQADAEPNLRELQRGRLCGYLHRNGRSTEQPRPAPPTPNFEPDQAEGGSSSGALFANARALDRGTRIAWARVPGRFREVAIRSLT